MTLRRELDVGQWKFGRSEEEEEEEEVIASCRNPAGLNLECREAEWIAGVWTPDRRSHT